MSTTILRGGSIFATLKSCGSNPENGDPNIVGLVDRQFRGSYSLVFHLLPKEANPERERQIRDPDFHRRTLFASWEKRSPGGRSRSRRLATGSGLAPAKRKVYRIEAATKQPGADANGQRLYCDYYLVLFTTNQTVVVRP